ncbi:MAG TPA: glycosyltransferase [Myxococcales bacterium]|nr:glycosyltransferase [Myxococcales bacterium]
MKIAIATDNYWPRVSGMAVSIDTFRQALEAQGHQVLILAPLYKDMDPWLDEKAGRRNVARFPGRTFWVSREDVLVSASHKRAVYRLLDQFRPDVVHVQTEFTLGWLSWRWAKANGTPLVFTAHTFWQDYLSNYATFLPRVCSYWLAKAVSRYIGRNADAFVAPTRRMRDVLLNYGVDVPISVIPTGFQESTFSGVNHEAEKQNSFLFEQYPQLKGKRVLLTVARLGKEKNHDFLVDVMGQLKDRDPNAMWLVVGDGPYRGELEAKLKARGLADRAVLTGYMAREKVKHAFALADVFMFASKTETQGLVTVEAMSLGRPVVAIGEMGTRDVMNGDNGGFMMREEAGPFADRVHQLLNDSSLHASKSAEAIRYSRRWTSSALAEKLAGVYTSVCKQLPATTAEGFRAAA